MIDILWQGFKVLAFCVGATYLLICVVSGGWWLVDVIMELITDRLWRRKRRARGFVECGGKRFCTICCNEHECVLAKSAVEGL